MLNVCAVVSLRLAYSSLLFPSLRHVLTRLEVSYRAQGDPLELSHWHLTPGKAADCLKASPLQSEAQTIEP